MAPTSEIALAVDVGGTKIETALVDRDGSVTRRNRIATVGDDADALYERVVEVIGDLRHAPVTVCGVGCGGPMTPGGELVSPLNIPHWRRFPLRARLADLLGVEVHVDNDAKAFALGEGWLGAAAGVGNFIGMVVSTGVGGGIVLDGRLLEGETGNAGHIGHVVVEPDGFALPDHVPGVLEAEASGTAIAAMTGMPARNATPEVIERTGRLVGRAVGSVANLLDLRLAVVAGSVALGFGGPFFVAAQTEVDRVADLDHSRGTRIVPAGLGDEGPLVGAAAVGFRGRGFDPLAWGVQHT